MDELLTITQAAKYLNVTTETLRRWEKTDRIKPVILKNKQRRYTKLMLSNAARHMKTGFAEGVMPGYSLGYCRVFDYSKQQQDSLLAQTDQMYKFMQKHAKSSMTLTDTYPKHKGVSKSLNYVIKIIGDGECSTLVTPHADCIGDKDVFDLFESFCVNNNVQILVLDELKQNNK